MVHYMVHYILLSNIICENNINKNDLKFYLYEIKKDISCRIIFKLYQSDNIVFII